jgi:hypothetical protein
VAPWWARAPARLALLLPLLAVVAWLGVPRIFGGSGDNALAGWCQEPAIPAALKVPPAAVERAVATSGLRRLLAGHLDVQGPVGTSVARSDGLPDGKTSAGPIDAGYELRWWTRQGNHRVADLFLFATASEAAAYVRTASSPDCRVKAGNGWVPAISGGVGLIWTNSHDTLQADVFFSRGNRAYRLSDMPPGGEGKGLADVNPIKLIATPVALACRLPDARCA